MSPDELKQLFRLLQENQERLRYAHAVAENAIAVNDEALGKVADALMRG